MTATSDPTVRPDKRGHGEAPDATRRRMDIPRAAPRNTRRTALIVGGGIALVAVIVAVSRLEPAVPTVARAAITVDSVRLGDMTIEVQAPGTLVPEHVRIIAAATAGRVEALPIRAGATVTPATTIVELSNTDVELQALQSEQQLTAAMSALASLRTSLRQQRLAQEGVVATTVAQQADARRQAALFDSLDRKGLSSAMEVAQARDRAKELDARLRVDRARLDEIASSEREQLVLMQDQIARLRAITGAQQRRVGSMHVVAGESGQLQVLPLELGQWVNPGMELARIAQPGRLKAMLRVPETQARDIVPGQQVRVDSHNGIVSGHVTRSDPSSQNGSVTVEVALDGPLPAGTRSDLSVDATIEVARLRNVLHVARPPYGDAGASITLYRLEPDGKEATRVAVKLGRVSANAVEITSGLAANERVIVSDLSDLENAPKVRVR